MTSKDKARELVNKAYGVEIGSSAFPNWDRAKKQALLMANEIDHALHGSQKNDSAFNYWGQVKEEIGKI